MQPLPHLYRVQTTSTPEAQVLTASSKGIPDLTIAGPAEFDGPGDQWSPETLLLSAVSNCLVLSFKAVAKASDFSWKSIECETQGKLEKIERKMLFTEVSSKITLQISDAKMKEKAVKLLEKSEAICIVSNSLNSKLSLECDIITG